MKRYLLIALTSLAFITSFRQIYANDAHHTKAEAQKTYVVKGEVITIDKAASKVELKHEAVTELDWPAMTMFFSVADSSQLDAFSIGDLVEFKFVKTSGGLPSITNIKPLK